jgi:two-component system cell cycle response regulator
LAEKILVVEDEADMRQALARFLTRLDYYVQTADCGEAGWRAIEETMFDLVVSDMAMEDLSGLELLKRIRISPNPSNFGILKSLSNGP